MSTGQPCPMQCGTGELSGSESLRDVKYIHSIRAGNSNEILQKKMDDGKIAEHSIGLVNRTGLHKWRS